MMPKDNTEIKKNMGNGVFCTSRELFYEGLKSHGQNLHLKRKSTIVSSQNKRSSFRGRGMEFFESRPYVALQDEVKYIDWKVSARLNGIYTKIFVEERNRPIFLAVDQRSPMYFGSKNCFKSVLAARIAARLAFAAINGQDTLSGLIFDDEGEHECAMGKNRKTLARFFGLLSQSTNRITHAPGLERQTWSIVLKKIANRIHAGSAVFIISDFSQFDEEHRHILYKIRKKADLFALFISDPLEMHLPAIGVVGTSFGNEQIIFDSNNLRLSQAYRKTMEDRKKQLNALFSSLAMPMIAFSTAQDIDIAMRRIFSGRW